MGPGDLLDTIDLGSTPPYDSTHQRIGHRHLQRSEGTREGGREGGRGVKHVFPVSLFKRGL